VKIKKFTQNGQTLLEVVVTIGVAMVIIGSLIALMNASNRRSTLARQATQASKLAQEGMEIVRNTRDVNAETPGAVRTGDATNFDTGDLCNTVPNFCSFDDLYSGGQDTFTVFLLDGADPSCGVASWCLVQTQPASEQNLLGIFDRSVTISDEDIPSLSRICSDLDLPDTRTKRVVVSVTWDSPIGSQERNATTCLTRWRQ